MSLLTTPAAGIHPFWTLVPLSVALGAMLVWLFGRLSNQEAIRETKRRLQARLYEMRLFIDEPRLMWQAQAALLRDNVRYARLALMPVAVLTLPMLLLFSFFDGYYGLVPLSTGSAVNVTVQLRNPIHAGGARPVLHAPDGFVVETPPVRVLAEKQICWRVRPIRPADGILSVSVDGESATKTIVADSSARYLSRRRVSSLFARLRYPAEPQLPDGSIDWIEVDYRAAELAGLSWIAWAVFISFVSALVFRRRLRVSF